MYCSSCGAKNGAESNYCRQCGYKMERAPTPKLSEEEFDRALPEEQQVTALLERAYRRRKDKDVAGAIAICQEVLQIRPNSTTAHGLLGQLYEQRGDRDLAVEQYERVLKLNPGSIADRVKLDDLKDGVGSRQPTKGVLPKVVVVDHDGAPFRGAMLWGVGFCILLIVFGAALAVAFNRRDDRVSSDVATLNRASKSSGDSARMVQSSGDARVTTTEKPRADALANSSRDGTPTSNAAGVGSASGYVWPGPGVQFSAPPIYVLPQNYGTQQISAAAPARTVRVKPVVNNAPLSERSPADTDQGSERIHLKVTESPAANSHDVTIQVPKRDDGKGDVKPGGSRQVAGMIKVTSHNTVVDPSAAASPDSDASGLISIGQEKMNKTDYGGAIQAFRKSLAGANDESAYVYEQMGHCYQARNENKNAVTMYERGRDEYRKLITAGKQIDRANGGIRICENGIKICSSE